MLHGAIRDHVDDFLRAAADRADGAGLPEFIAREFREFLTCGVLAHGFARVRSSAVHLSICCRSPARTAYDFGARRRGAAAMTRGTLRSRA